MGTSRGAEPAGKPGCPMGGTGCPGGIVTSPGSLEPGSAGMVSAGMGGWVAAGWVAAGCAGAVWAGAFATRTVSGSMPSLCIAGFPSPPAAAVAGAVEPAAGICSRTVSLGSPGRLVESGASPQAARSGSNQIQLSDTAFGRRRGVCAMLPSRAPIQVQEAEGETDRSLRRNQWHHRAIGAVSVPTRETCTVTELEELANADGHIHRPLRSLPGDVQLAEF